MARTCQDVQDVGPKLLANARLPIEAKRRKDWHKFVNNSEINFKWAAPIQTKAMNKNHWLRRTKE